MTGYRCLPIALSLSAGLLLGATLYVVVYVGWWAVIRLERRRRLRERALRL